ncbi:MAG: hypothetical protein IJ188_10915 [Clostridia bacterium]|nr:hypothetical protein [Clostridia bacterium]
MTHPINNNRPLKSQKQGPASLRGIGALLVILFFCQLAVLCYFNLTQLRNHMGYDSSWNYLRAALMWREKALTSPIWGELSNLNLDTHLILISLLYGITGDLLLSYGLGNIAIVLLLLWVLWEILGRMKVRFHARMISLNLMICPYLSSGFYLFNDLGYFSNVLSGASFYSLRMLIALMVMYEFLKIIQDQKFGWLVWIIWPLCVLSGYSSGVYLIVVLLAPYLAYELEMAAIQNSWKQLIRKESVFAYLCCLAVLVGKLFGFNALDNTFTWTSLQDLWTNFGAVIQGFMKLMQALPVLADDKPLMSIAGLARVFILVIFALMAVSIGFLLRRVGKEWKHSRALLFFVNLLLVNFLIFGLFNAQYGTEIFEERYLLVAFFAAIILTALFFNELDPQRILSLMLSLAMTGALLMVDIQSDYNYLRTTNDVWPLAEIQSLAEEYDAGIVYCWGYDLNVIRRVMRACDLNRVYKEIPDEGGYYTHWDDYYYFDTNAEYTGPTLLLCPADQQLVPEETLAKFTWVGKLEYSLFDQPRQIDVYTSDHNPTLWD